MQEAEVLVTLAEIAGVFVGFGALIAVRSGGASDSTEVWYIRWVLTMGVWVMVAGLIPVVLGSYDLSRHEVWSVSSLVVLTASAAVYAVNYRTPESQAFRSGVPRVRMARQMAVWALIVLPVLGAPLLVVLGLFPEQEAALYLTAVVVGVFLAALTLLMLVFMHRGPQVAALDKGEQTAE